MEARNDYIFGLGLLLCLTTFAMPALARDYDLVISNVRVIDPETMYDDIANVGITDGRIVKISILIQYEDHRQTRNEGNQHV